MNDALLDVNEGPSEMDDAPEDPVAVPSGLLSGYLPYLEQLAVGAATPNYSIYDKRLTTVPPIPGFDLEPYTVYFYYIRLDSDGKLRVKHYTKSSAVAIPHASLQQVVQDLVDNVRTGTNNPPPDGRNFEDIEWTRKSYIAFFVDEANWDLHRNGNLMEGVRFTTAGGNTPNHAFFDAVDLQITVVNASTGQVDQRSAIAFVNHMKRNAQGDDLLDLEEQRFKFEMIFDVAFADQSPAPLIAIFDPTGTNLGPPVAPPP